MAGQPSAAPRREEAHGVAASERAATSAEARAGIRRPVGRGTVSQRNAMVGLGLTAPALLLVGIFALFPLGFGVYISLTNWPLIGPYHFVGLANYQSLIHNPVFL